MKHHELDLTSLILGSVLVVATIVLALHEWTQVHIDAGVLVPIVLIGLGVLTLAATFLRNSPR